MKFQVTIVGILLLTAFMLKPSPAYGVPVFPAENEVTPGMVVYYFHGTSRCRTCRTIEEYTRQALNDGFADELEKGGIELRPINVDLKENRHYINDYRLFTRSVVVSSIREGKETGWKRLDRVWDLVKNKSEFIAYIQNEIREMRSAEHK